ncbi:phosphoribosylformylglycinamidine cyclo-ligase [Salimicrobium flavidum]|uniref:Phosphoribosylformylglycinamidine cyclo-ligase n=1 Tax=Salimicrobium flavidum TaxID=570947 RepID=A0A1N7KCM0_9BACI|nr:phosphoribosylformylglycinamidine cyclo-ligase [Salimicrobium flavidum]SIS59345.1 phosphoribosylformylglycinamidine cyclo-ligase [Salimicrobium flavidum]
MSEAYKRAGVDVEAGYEAVERMKKHVSSTHREEVMGGLGSFGGLFDISGHAYDEPVLVTGTDGVGTKLKLAFEMDRHDTIGVDLVAMCVNDIAAQGADPLLFLDYIGCAKNDPDVIEAIVKGIAEGCKQAGCALIGGETAEMPGMYNSSEYDLAGFTVGMADKQKLITGDDVEEGDVLVGLPSSGVHSNGFSLVRAIVEQNGLSLEEKYSLSAPLGDVLLTPTAIYVKDIQTLRQRTNLHGIAHITGGGFYENIPRMMPEGLGAKIDVSRFSTPEIFPFLKHYGKLTDEDMYGTFNMGIGMVIAVTEEDAQKAVETVEGAVIIGEVTAAEGVDIL